MLFITTLICMIVLVLQIKIHNAVKNGRTLSKIQTNLVSTYFNSIRTIPATTYAVLGTVGMIALSWYALMNGAWLSFLIFIAYIFFTTRTHTLLRSKRFVNTDANGVEIDAGRYWTPVN